MGTGVTGLVGGVKVNDARATSLLLLAVKPATVMVHLGRVLVGDGGMVVLGTRVLGNRDVCVMSFVTPKGADMTLCSESFVGGGRESH